MIPYALRLLAALLTFAVGLAAAWLFNFKSAPAPVVLGESEVTTVSVLDKSHSCSFWSSSAIFAGILQTKTIDTASPAYPFYAKKVHLGGKVVVKVEVDEDGRVVKAQAQGGFGMLPEAAEKDARETRLPPTRLKGQPVRVAGYIMYNYVLD
jgi:outer membrane biosynthesis protein TonB